jgi:TonB family protein
VRHTFAYGAGLTLLLHAALFAALLLLVPPRPAAMRRFERVQVRLVASPPRVTPPPVKPATPPPTPPPAPAARAKAPPPRVAKAEPPTAAPAAPSPKAAPAPAAPAAPTPAAPRRSFSVSLEATVPGGGVAVPASAGPGDVGGTPGAPRGPRRSGAGPAPSPDVGPERSRGSAPVDLGSVTQAPGLVGKPSDAELRAAYPEAARRQGLDGDVRLEILVDETGRVTRVKLVRPAGNGFDAAAERLIRKHRFRPAQKAGQPVAVWIPWTYKFRLED